MSPGVATALGWAYGGTAVRIAVQFVGGVLLARILGPHSFGLAAAAWAIVGIGSQFTDLGFSAALIQRRELSPRDVRFAFTVQMLLGTLAAAGFLHLARICARAMGDESLAPVIRCLAFALVAQAMGQTAIALLRRDLDFKTAQMAQTIGIIVGTLFVAIPLAAYSRYAALSVAIGQLVQIAVASGIAYAAVRHSVRPALTPEHPLMDFGLKATGTNLVNWLIASLDSLAITKAYGIGFTGFYNRAQNLAIMPAASFVQVVQSVLFPAYSRGVGDRESTRRAYLTSLSAVAMILLPVVTALAVLAPTVVLALYGPQWTNAAEFVTPLALTAPFHSAIALSGPLLWAHERVAFEFRVQLAALTLFVVLLVPAMRTAPVWIAWAVLIVSVARAVPMAMMAFQTVGASARDAIRILRGPVVLASVAGVTAVFAGTQLVGAIAAVAGTLSATLAIFYRSLLPEEILRLFPLARRATVAVATGGAR